MKKRWRSKLNRLRQRLILTPAEKKIVAFILAAFLLGLGTKYYRETHPSPAPSSIDISNAQSRTAPNDTLPKQNKRKSALPLDPVSTR